MISKEDLLQEIRASKEFFERSARVLSENDSMFTPQPEMMSVSQQVAHVAHTIRWLLDGAFSPSGFDMNFIAHKIEIMAVTSLSAARISLAEAFDYASDTVTRMSEGELSVPIAQGPIMGGAPRYEAILAIVEHTAHHRGALSVYSRLLGKHPAIPYMET